MKHLEVLSLVLVAASCLHQGQCSEDDASGLSDTTNLNNVVDNIIDKVRALIHIKINGTLELPDLQRSTKRRLAWFHFTSGIKATQGVLNDLSSIRRIGNSTLTLTDDSLKVKLGLGIENWKLNFGQFKAWYGVFSVSDSMTVDIGENSITSELEVYDDGVTCNATLNSLTVDVLKGLKIKNKGLGLLDGLLSLIESWILDYVAKEVKYVLENSLNAFMSEVLKDLPVCRIL